MKYNKNWIEQKENQLNAEICEAFYLYRKIINREFSWNIFIEYQNILVDALFYLRKAEFEIKNKIKEIRKKKRTYYKEKVLKNYIERFNIYEHRIKVMGDFLAYIFYVNDKELINNHLQQQNTSMNSVGSGTFTEVNFIKDFNKENSPYFYIYNNITSFLRIADVSIFGKREHKIVGYGEIKSGKPNKKSKIEASITVISKYKLSLRGVEKEQSKKLNSKFLNHEMIKHLDKQIENMKENLKPKDIKIRWKI